MTLRLAACLLVLAAALPAQRRVDPHNTHFRVICVVPMIGKGTPADPRRPQYAPWPASRARNGIVAWSHQVSDDGRFALVEFVALNRAALLPMLNDKSVKTFERGKSNKDELQGELKKYRKDFDIQKFGAVLP
jgi:hypothetical protein